MRAHTKIIATLALVALIGTVAFYGTFTSEDSLAMKKREIRKATIDLDGNDHPHHLHEECGWAKMGHKVEKPHFIDEVKESYGPLPKELDPHYEDFLLASTGTGTWANMRFKADFSNLDSFNVESVLKDKVKNELVKAAFSFLSKALTVAPVADKIKIHPYYRNH
jgi:hypothetical protein